MGEGRWWGLGGGGGLGVGQVCTGYYRTSSDAFFDTCKMIEIFARYMNNYLLLSTRLLVSLRRLTVRRPAFALPIVN